MAERPAAPAYVLDAYACMAYLADEPGRVEVEGVLRAATAGQARVLTCWVNVVEVYYLALRRRGRAVADSALSVLRHLPLSLVLPDEQLCLTAAELKGLHPVSLADAFAAALAITSGAELLTGDPDFAHLSPMLRVLWLSGPSS